MKVYRIEHKDTKRGPYVGFGCEEIVSPEEGYFGDRCPGPVEDGIDRGGLTYQHHFGFAKLRQMFLWFKARHVFKMRKKGFRVYRYKIADEYVLLGGKQLAFIRTKATVREEVKLSLMARHLCSFGS